MTKYDQREIVESNMAQDKGAKCHNEWFANIMSQIKFIVKKNN